MKTTKVAFLGLGLMGSGMAARLLGAGYSLTVYNRTRAKAEPLAGLGATLADSPAEAVAGAEIIFSMLADDAACRAVWLGSDGALAAAPVDAVLVESSTVTVGWIDELNMAAQARGLALIDAPVTGSKPQAAAGQLLFLVGGDAATLEKIRPALLFMGRDAIHLGPTGSGARMKLINNFLCGVQLASLAEGIAMIERSGLDPARAVSVLTQGAPGSPLVNGVSARMMQQQYAPNFALNLMAKDLRYAAQEGAEQGIDAITAKAALRVFENAIAAGDGEKDIAAVVEHFR
ncbi:MAG TPA: NAD(P)-dependent oxidoreductase [Acidobacteriaceae bacterium]|nr:NAD(P)-dependent oxidoreductase [Acidobacteriaceae bacterium]